MRNRVPPWIGPTFAVFFTQPTLHSGCVLVTNWEWNKCLLVFRRKFVGGMVRNVVGVPRIGLGRMCGALAHMVSAPTLNR